MDTPAMAKQMINFQKTVFDNSFNAMSIVQDQTENMINNFMDQVPWMTQDMKKQMKETVTFTKKARDDFKKVMDDGYSKIEQMFDK